MSAIQQTDKVIAQCFGFIGTHLIGKGQDPNKLFVGYLIGAGAMILGGVVAAVLAVDAEGQVTRRRCDPAVDGAKGREQGRGQGAASPPAAAPKLRPTGRSRQLQKRVVAEPRGSGG